MNLRRNGSASFRARSMRILSIGRLRNGLRIAEARFCISAIRRVLALFLYEYAQIRAIASFVTVLSAIVAFFVIPKLNLAVSAYAYFALARAAAIAAAVILSPSSHSSSPSTL